MNDDEKKRARDALDRIAEDAGEPAVLEGLEGPVNDERVKRSLADAGTDPDQVRAWMKGIVDRELARDLVTARRRHLLRRAGVTIAVAAAALVTLRLVLREPDRNVAAPPDAAPDATTEPRQAGPPDAGP
jgi:hypothetical protein